MYGPPTVFGDLIQSVIANAQWSAGSGVPGPSTVFLVFEIITWVVFWVIPSSWARVTVFTRQHQPGPSVRV